MSSAAILGDDPVATAAAALGMARTQARRRRVFVADLLGDGSPLSALVPGDDDLYGVSDMVNYGVSLGRAARRVPGAPNLYVVQGGAESPLTDEILGASWWSSLFEQVKRSGALVLVAAPSIVPSLERLVSRTEGAVVVGDEVAGEPELRAPLLGEVRSPTAMRRAAPTAERVERAAPTAPTPSRTWLWVALVFVLLGAGAFAIVPRWKSIVAKFAGDEAPIPPAPKTAAPLPVRARPTDADYGVQFLYLNSAQDANAILAKNADSLPAATITMVKPATDSVPWYSLIVGAFPDSASAQSFLTLARTRGLLPTGAGRVVRTPYALLVDSAQSESMAAVRRSAYRGRGIPAYTLRDSAGMWRIYAGAFASESDGALLKHQLDSLNIQSVLVTRTGSGS